MLKYFALASYYRQFVPKFAAVAGPLHLLTKVYVPFIWTPQCQMAFDELKRLLTSAPVLAYPQFDRYFILETDASAAGLGAVLAQKQDDRSTRPIAYASRTLQPHEKKYGATEMEGLGVVWAIKYFRPYLYGHPCEVYTDHSALTSLLNTPQPLASLLSGAWLSRSWTSRFAIGLVAAMPMQTPLSELRWNQPVKTRTTTLLE